MSLMNTHSAYGKLTRTLHMLTALFVIGLLIAGALMGGLHGPIKGTVYNLHKLSGLTLLSIAVVFVLWSIISTKPAYPGTMALWQRALARLTHVGLYLAMLAMPISGWVMSTAAGHPPSLMGMKLALPTITPSKHLAHQAGDIHYLIAWIFTGLIALHVFGALVHKFYYKDNIVKRMFS